MKIPLTLEQTKNSLYNEKEFLFFLECLKEFGYIDEGKYVKIKEKIGKKELTDIIEILVKYELATWLERPFVIFLATYFGSEDFLNSIKTLFSTLGDEGIYAFFQAIKNQEVGISKENIFLYFLSIVPIVVAIRFLTLKIITTDKDIPHKNTFCILGSHPFPTTFTWLASFTYILSGYKIFYDFFILYKKVKREVGDIMNMEGKNDVLRVEILKKGLKSKILEII